MFAFATDWNFTYAKKITTYDESAFGEKKKGKGCCVVGGVVAEVVFFFCSPTPSLIPSFCRLLLHDRFRADGLGVTLQYKSTNTSGTMSIPVFKGAPYLTVVYNDVRCFMDEWVECTCPCLGDASVALMLSPPGLTPPQFSLPPFPSTQFCTPVAALAGHLPNVWQHRLGQRQADQRSYHDCVPQGA